MIEPETFLSWFNLFDTQKKSFFFANADRSSMQKLFIIVNIFFPHYYFFYFTLQRNSRSRPLLYYLTSLLNKMLFSDDLRLV